MVFGCERHVANLIKKNFERLNFDPALTSPDLATAVVDVVYDDENFGQRVSAFDPTHIVAGTKGAYDLATQVVEKRGTSTKVILFK